VSGDTGVAYAAHVAGFIAGLLFVLLFVERPRPPDTYPYTYPPPRWGR
jgi:membrane associated rhomboid family serine protease